VDLLAWPAAISGCVDVHPTLHQPAWVGPGRVWTRSPRLERSHGCVNAFPPEQVGCRGRWRRALPHRPPNWSQAHPFPVDHEWLASYPVKNCRRPAVFRIGRP
jgi:hypothetical protein